MTISQADDASKTNDLFEQRQGKPATSNPAVEIKGSVFTLPVLRLRRASVDAINNELSEQVAQAPQFFENAPVVIDLLAVRDAGESPDFARLRAALRELRLIPVGVQNGSGEQTLAAIRAGFAVLKGGGADTGDRAKPKRPKAESKEPASEVEATQARGASDQTAEQQIAEAASIHGVSTVVTQPVRSGQRVYARGGDLILLAAVNAGAEIIADGNIHVYAPLRGRALAGVSGDTTTRIFCQSMEAELVAVAGHYRVFEEKVPAEVHRKPVQIFLDGEQLIIAPLSF